MSVGVGVQQLGGGGAVQVGKGVRVRWHWGQDWGCDQGQGWGQDQENWKRRGEKKKNSEENTTKGKNVFIQFKIEKKN